MAYTFTYRLDAGFIEGRVNTVVPENQDAPPGYGLYRVPDIQNDDGSITITYPEDGKMVDVTQNPPVLIDTST